MEIIVKNEKEIFKKGHSLYQQCYVQGIEIILNNILKKDKEKDINNLIAFIGERGSGKTTALTEFSQILDKSNVLELYENLGKKDIERGHEADLKKKEFKVLPIIDASILEAGEDPFLLTLASLLEECENFWKKDITLNTYERQEMVRAFNEIYRNYVGLQNQESNEYLGESIISILRSMPSSEKVKAEFDKLLDLISRMINQGEDRKNYWVVVIDDLDLNVRNGMKMLEKLYKFLTHKDVIVITAIDYKQLSIIAEHYFLEEQFKGSKDSYHTEHSKELALDYLDKFLPIAHRIYMPDIVKRRYELEIKEEIEEENKQKYNLKDYILLRIAEKMHIYYDTAGTKIHFAEQDTVRKVFLYAEFLESLNDVAFTDCKMIKGICDIESIEKKEKIALEQNNKMEIYDVNHERFNSDIKERMLYEKTTSEQRVLFETLVKMDLRKRAQYFCKFKDKWLAGKTMDANIDGYEYAYGDMLECIYTWGRESLADKQLLHCIMASFTTEMVREYLNYMYSGNENSRERSKERLKQFVGVSFMNDWLNVVLPTMNYNKRRKDKDKYRDLELLPVEYKCSYRLQRSEAEELEKRIDNDWKQISGILREKKWIKILECMDMLLSNCKTNHLKNEHVEFNIEIKENGIDTIVMICRFATEQATFDIGGFIIKSIESVDERKQCSSKIVDKMKKAILRFLKERYKEQDDYINNKSEEIRKELEMHSMFYQWETAKDDIAFPFFDLDLSYNVMKRVRKRYKEKMYISMLSKNILKPFLKIYDWIEEELNRQNGGIIQNDYGKKFADYPFILTIRELLGSEELNRFLYNLFNAGMELPSPDEYGIE